MILFNLNQIKSFVNNVDSNEMADFEPSHLDLHCLLHLTPPPPLFISE